MSQTVAFSGLFEHEIVVHIFIAEILYGSLKTTHNIAIFLAIHVSSAAVSFFQPISSSQSRHKLVYMYCEQTCRPAIMTKKMCFHESWLIFGYFALLRFMTCGAAATHTQLQMSACCFCCCYTRHTDFMYRLLRKLLGKRACNLIWHNKCHFSKKIHEVSVYCFMSSFNNVKSAVSWIGLVSSVFNFSR